MSDVADALVSLIAMLHRTQDEQQSDKEGANASNIAYSTQRAALCTSHHHAVT